jgi:hypothetical protein
MMAPVSVIADETSAPEETQTTEVPEKEETKETEKKTPKTTEKPAPKESKATEKTEPEETKETDPEEQKPAESKETESVAKEPAETVKETDPTESEDKKPAQTEETEASKPEETKPSDSKEEEPAETSVTEPSQTTKPNEEDAPEPTVTPEAGGKDETHSVPPKNANMSITSVSLIIIVPNIGEKPEYEAIFPDGANYYSDSFNADNTRNDMNWYDVTVGAYVNPDTGVFQAGHQYRVRLFLTAKEGYAFSDSTTAKVNGSGTEASMHGDQLEVKYTFQKLGTEITYASIKIDAPKIGEKPDYTTVFPTGAFYYNEGCEKVHSIGEHNSVCWFDKTTNSYMTPDVDVFKEDHIYSVSIFLTPKNGYAFSYNTLVEINGMSAYNDNLYHNQGLCIHYVFPRLIQIQSVDVSIREPVSRMKPDYTPVSSLDVNYYSDAYNEDYFRNDIYWYDISVGQFVNPDSGVFKDGHIYRVAIYLTAKSGCNFKNSTTATLNGEKAETLLTEDGQLKVTYTFPVIGVPISYVSFFLDKPVVGAKPDYTASFTSGANYYSALISSNNVRNDINWYDDTAGVHVNPDGGVFQSGHQYRVSVLLTAKEGFFFNNTTTTTMNFENVESSLHGDQLEVVYTFPVVSTIISTVSISLDTPAPCAKPDYTAAFPAGANYYTTANSSLYRCNDIVWFDNTTNNYVDPETDVFKVGHVYSVAVYLTAKSEFRFADNTTATLNGQTAEAWIKGDQFGVTYTFPVVDSNVNVGDFNYRITNSNTDGTGTVTLIGVTVKKASVSIPSVVDINGVALKINRIGPKAFYGDKTIKTVYIGNNIAIIDASAFYGCSNLTKVSGGKGLKTIGSSAFAKCSKLKSLSIASTVLSKIGTYAFNKDSKLKTIYIRNTVKLTKSGVKKSLKGSKVKTVKVKKSKVKKYKKYFKKKNSGRSVKVKK